MTHPLDSCPASHWRSREWARGWPAKSARILVADADDAARGLIQRELCQHCRLEEVVDGRFAFEAFRRRPPDLVLASLELPGLLDLLRAIRAHAAASDVPVIVLCGESGQGTAAEDTLIAADDVLRKPLSAPELVGRVRAWLETSCLRRELAKRERDMRVHVAESREALRASEQRFRAFASASVDGITIIDKGGKILEWSDGEEHITGISRADALGQPLWVIQDRLVPDEQRGVWRLTVARQKILSGFDQGLGLRRLLEEEIQRPDGTRRTLQTMVFALRSGGQLLAGSISRDITDRKGLEEDVRAKQAMLEEVERVANLGHWERDLRSERFSWSDQVFRIFGHVPGVVSPSFEALLGGVVPDDRPSLIDALNATAADGLVRRQEFRVVTPQGSVRYVYGTVGLLRDGRGEPARIFGTIQDITDRRRAEDSLRESEERFRTMADSVPVIIWVSDAEGNGRLVNRAHYDFFGQGLYDVEGPNWQVLMHPEDAKAYVNAFRAALRKRTPFRAQTRVRHRSGEWRWLESYVVPRYSERGEFLGMVGASEDITSRKKAEEDLRRTRKDLERAQAVARVGSWRVLIDGQTLEWSQETYRIFGIPQGTAVTYEAFIATVHPDDRERVAFAWQAALCGETYDVEHRVLVGGEVRWVRGLVEPEFDSTGRLTGGFGTIQDISSSKEMERALADASRRKDEFLALLSHELRNPLAPLRTGIEVLARAEKGGELSRRTQAIIERQVRHLTSLVDDLLDVTRISRGKIQLQKEALDFGEIVRHTTEDLRATFAASAVKLRQRLAPGPVWLYADPVRVAQIVGNLLGNAAKFTPAGGHVEVSLEHDGSHALLRVRDTGVGITHDMLDSVFEPFIQADRSLERTRGGLGLGLALVKLLVELHGGTVCASSDGPGQGSEFSVCFPLASGMEHTASRATAEPPRRRRALVIEDNKDAADSLKDLLELMGHDVRVAYDGPSGLGAARVFQPEVVLCDIGLPDMDGYEVARRVRSQEGLTGTRLVAVTGYALPEDRQRAVEAGFTSHLAKPASFEALDRVLRESCS